MRLDAGLVSAVLLLAQMPLTPPPLPPPQAQSESAAFEVELVCDGLRVPSALAFLPDGRALVTDRGRGRMSLLDVRRGRPARLEGVPAGLVEEEAGLHDVKLHPDYAVNGWIYVSYTHGERHRSTTVVDRVRLEGTRLIDRSRVFAADAYSEDRYHYGGKLTFLGGSLFLTVGDRHWPDRAQDLSNHSGKILRVHDDGRVPSDNPFVGRAGARPEIWSYGHRNPQGLTVRPGTEELWSTEHGPLGGDELNLIRKGANYGWPVVSYGWQYSGGPIGKGIVSEKGMEPPVWVWTPAIAPSGIFFYRGAGFPRWRGSLFSGAMGLRHVNRLVLAEGHVVLEERLLNRRAGRVRVVSEGPDGFLYIGNDDGRILRLRPRP